MGAKAPEATVRGRGREDAFSYRCSGCSRCCYNKRIQTNPFELAVLADHLGLSTGDVIERYTTNGVALRQASNGACVFLSPEHGCTVHPARPLVCRLYPLARIVAPDGQETFVDMPPHPQTDGKYGQDGTIADWLSQQGAEPFMEAADAYYQLYLWLQSLSFDEGAEREDGVETWLDLDAVLEAYSALHEIPIPSELLERSRLHIAALAETAASLQKAEQQGQAKATEITG